MSNTIQAHHIWTHASINPSTPGPHLVCIGKANITGGVDGRYAEFSVRLAWFLGDKWELLDGVYYDFLVAFWMPLPEPPCKPSEYWRYKEAAP